MKHDGCVDRLAGLGLAVALSSLLLVSCVHTNSYSEPVGPKEDVPVLEATVPVWIVSVDGLKVSGFGGGDRKQLRIAPGSHIVEVAYAKTTIPVRVMPPSWRSAVPNAREFNAWATQFESARTSSREVKVNIVAEKGRTYVINARVEGSRWIPSVAEFRTLDR